MDQLAAIVQIVLSGLMIFGILLQHRAAGLSATFGGAGATYVQRRGAERVIYVFTAWVSLTFFALSILRWYL